MAIPVAMIAASAAAPVIGGIIGNIAGERDRAAARAAADRALNEITSVGAGPDLARQIYLREFQRAGVLTPEIEETISQNSSALANVQEDPALRNAQMQALQTLQQRAQVGLSPEDRARLAQIQQDVAAQAEGRRQQILQNFASRGQGGSGNELLAQLTSSQSATQDAANQGLGVASMASQNALAALAQSGQLAGSLRSQDFGVNSARAQAQDELNRFNVQNQISTQARNVASRNSAQAANLNNAQQIANANTAMYNNELERQRQAEQQMYLNRFNNAVAKANAYNNQASNLMNQGNQTAQMWQSIGSGVGQGFGAVANYNANQQALDAYKERTSAMKTAKTDNNDELPLINAGPKPYRIEPMS